MAFLQKLIDCVQEVNGTPLSVKPAKIVAGHEAEKTNEWLQAMYLAATSGKDFKSAIRKTLGQGDAEPQEKKVEPKPKTKPKPKPKEPEPKPVEQKPAKESPEDKPSNAIVLRIREEGTSGGDACST